MNHTPGHFPASRTAFLKMIEESPHADLLRDEQRLRKCVVDAMKTSDDPLTREIGEGLAGGTMSWHTVATTSAYSDFVDRSLAALQQFDFNTLVEDLEVAQPTADDHDRRPDDDGEDLWQGLGGKRR